MPQRKAKATTDDSRAAVLRKRSVDDAADLEATPTKRRRSFRNRDADDALLQEEASATEDTDDTEDAQTEDSTDRHAAAGTAARKSSPSLGTPTTATLNTTTTTTTPRRRGRPAKDAAASQASTPSKPKTPARSIFATPLKDRATELATPKRRAADRSARKKSARALIENVVGDGPDTDEEDADDDVLAREIYEDDSDVGDHDAGLAAALGADDGTPSKTTGRGGRGGGRAARGGRGRARMRPAKSPTPPRDLPPHELYFLHNKPGRPKTSDNTLGSLALLTHDEYLSLVGGHVDRHGDDVEYLEDLHAELFPQWMFELSQGYSLCLYGFGSKRRLLQKLAAHLSSRAPASPFPGSGSRTKTIIVNGYAPTTTIREILSCIGTAVDPSLRPPSSSPTAMLSSILTRLSSLTQEDDDDDDEEALTLTILINSIDASPLRKTSTQSILSRLASHPQINLVCSADTPDFPLLWDIGIRSAFNFLFHDCTTFAPFTAELDVVDEVHELLGRRARRVNGREGVAFVLRSLPENAKNLFRLLVGEVLVAMEDEGGTSRADEAAGVEYRIMYNKAVEEFICSSEMAFRTLLKEFHDHQIITSRKDALGTELLSVPFQKEELEAMLEDLMS
ncbi:hypothetical protein E4U41_005097 [Claviceps citrina]|nr:hypothetical protein E4U41_005097 [Claviceps citrina]